MTKKPALDRAVENLRDYYADRLNAGIPLTLEEWDKLTPINKELWEEAITQFRIKEIALKSHFLADTLTGGTLAVEAVWEMLPEDVQDTYLKKWGKKNADSKQ